MTEAVPVSDPQLICRVEQFYYREARLLDERCFSQWLGLLSEDISYTMPSRFIPTPNPAQRGTEAFHAIDNELERPAADTAPYREENIFTLAIRADRALKANAWSENPAARTRRFISNVEVMQCGEELQVYSNFMLIYSRHSNNNYRYSGQRRDLLRPLQDSFNICQREVILDWNVINAPTIGLLF